MPQYFDSTAAFPMNTKVRRYASGGRVAAKEGRWIQKAVKGMRKDKPCTGKKFGGPTCPPGSKRYNLAKTFKKMGRERKAS
jgi:hypothetical protein